MENHVFGKARSKDEYLSFVARLIIHVREMSEYRISESQMIFFLNFTILDNKSKNPDAGNSQAVPQQNQVGQQQGIQDPINALQNLASQGTRNVQPQMMGQQQGPGLMQQQQQQNQNVMQQNQNVMQNQVPGMMPQQMNPQNQGNIGQQQLNPMNQMQMNQMGPAGPKLVKRNVGPNQVVGPMNPQVNQMNQMVNNQQQMMGGQNVLGNALNQPPVPIQGGQPQMNPMMNNPGMNNQMGAQMMPGNNQMNNQGMMGPRMAPNQMMNQLNPGAQQVLMNNQNQMMNMRKQEMMMPNQGAGQFPPVRNSTPNFLRQSPSPMSVPSPIGLQHNQMVASPAMVPSPQAPMSNPPQRVGMGPNVMAPSPSGNMMNTPGQPQGDYVQSPMNPHDDQIYREKYNQLTKYKEPLKKVISRVGTENNSEKAIKLKKLLEILSNPEARIPLETLVKCEIVLMNQFGALKDVGPTSINNPLYDAISNNLQNPLANHTIQRTFKPSVEAWFGPEIKNMPPSRKRRLSDDQVVPNVNEIPHVLQREIARLDAKFKITLDQTAQTIGSKSIKLICCLDDKFLPCVPPINISIPESYPMASPQCHIMEHNTPFLIAVEKSLRARISKLPERFSLTHILETWTLAIRASLACNPSSPLVEPTETSVLMAI